jgi:hypothetical protein
MLSSDLCPVLADRDLVVLDKSVGALYVASDREYHFLGKPITSFPATPGEGGLANNSDHFGQHLMAWWLCKDENALQSAFNLADWLLDKHALWDRSHGQRNKNFAALALIAKETGRPTSEYQKYMGGFKAWFNYLDRDPYVNGNFSGATFRPIVRALHEAIVVAWIANRLELAGQPCPGIAAGAPAALATKAKASMQKWLDKRWDPPHGSGFGWTAEPGSWPTVKDGGLGQLNDFPYLDGRDRFAMASNDTWFMHGCIFPYEAMLVFLCDKDFARSSGLAKRAEDVAHHSLYFGYDPATGRYLSAIGFDAPLGFDDVGCYAPHFSDDFGRFKDWPLEMRAGNKSSPGYFCLDAIIAARLGQNKSRALFQGFFSCGARCLVPGEIPWGLVEGAVRFGY